MYTVMGYDMMGNESEATFDSFMKAAKCFFNNQECSTTIMYREKPATCMNVNRKAWYIDPEQFNSVKV